MDIFFIKKLILYSCLFQKMITIIENLKSDDIIELYIETTGLLSLKIGNCKQII